jgi:hypothetical protein
MTNSLATIVILATGDNVGIALRDIPVAAVAVAFDGSCVSVKEAIPQGHKVALVELRAGDAIVRNTMPVGQATQSIEPGALVHTHNVISRYLNNEVDHHE